MSVYQSKMCWEFSELCTTPCQSLTVPQVQIGTRPMASRTIACTAMIAGTARQSAHDGMRLVKVPAADVLMRRAP